jgi:hypothetical protein
MLHHSMCCYCTVCGLVSLVLRELVKQLLLMASNKNKEMAEKLILLEKTNVEGRRR